MNQSAVTTFRLAVLCALGVAATAASAQSMVTARVLSAQPVVEQVPVSDCGPYGARPSGAGAAVGALTGGLIGSQLGKGSGHIAGAVLGALGGAFLGNTAEAAQYGGHGGCATGYSQRVTGYDVTYDVGGRSYQTRMAQAPGQWIQVPAPDAYYGQPAWGAVGEAQTYPVPPAPVAAYPMPSYPAAGESSGVVMAPPVGYGGYAPPAYPGSHAGGYAQPYPYPPSYSQAYSAPVYPAYPPTAYAPPPPVRYVTPVGVNLSIGGVIGGGRHGHGRGGWSLGVGSGW